MLRLTLTTPSSFALRLIEVSNQGTQRAILILLLNVFDQYQSELD